MKSSATSHGKTWIIIVVIVLLLTLLAPELYLSLRDNFRRLVVSNAFFNTSSTSSSTEQLQLLMQKACGFSNDPGCESIEWSSNKSILEAADRLFMSNQDPLIVVEESVEIPATGLSPMGTSTSNQLESSSGTLFSEGYFQMRVFLAGDSEACWRFSVRAKHDDPPPVNLALRLDDEKIGELSFIRGDRTWETLSVTAYAKPGAYWLRVWFVNDFLDREMNADRNAYIEYFQIAQVEEKLCEGH